MRVKEELLCSFYTRHYLIFAVIHETTGTTSKIGGPPTKAGAGARHKILLITEPRNVISSHVTSE